MQGPGAVLGTLLDGRYRVESVLARGGMSTVYRGLDTRLDRPVAIKVMDPRFAGDQSFLDRFIREARATARLRHPAVVAVHDQGVDYSDGEDRVFLVMELVDGGTLRDLLRGRRELPVPLALSVLEPVLSALAAAHREGLIHRDIKPENVLIGRGGEVKVADFGLVRAVADASSTSDSMILGTVAYLSPEQVATGAADARSDVYSAGIVLYEMLTGTPPFTGDTALSVAYRHVNDQVPPPSRTIPGIPGPLDQLVIQATRRDPAARPEDASAFLLGLQRVRSQLGIRRMPVPVPGTLAAAGPDDTVPAGRGQRAATASAGPGGPAAQGPAAQGGLAGPGGGPQGTRAYTRAAVAPPSAWPDASVRRGQQQRRPAGPEPVDPYLLERARDRRTFLIWMLIVLLLAAMIGYGAWHLAIGRWTAVPSLDNLDRAGVEQALRGAGLDAEVIDDHHDVVPVGRLVSVVPAPGTRLLRGNDVRAVFSQGRPRVPEIAAGTPLDRARELLSAADLEANHDKPADAFDDHVPESAVLRISPPAGTELTVGAPVALVLSKGPPPVEVPDVRGRTVAEATAALQAAGLRVAPQPRQQFDDEVPGGQVIGTEPGAGSTSRKGHEVVLDVSNALVVPDVTAAARAEALAKLREAGFEPVEDGDGAGDDNARVAATEPGAGALVDPASNRITVELTYQVTVPALVGLRVDEARATLDRLGLRAEVLHWFGGGGSSRVVGQFPGQGTRLAPGSTVRLTAL